MAERPERRLSFGAAAAAYERFRPGYPDQLVAEVLAYAGEPVRTALEIGAGTGKATRVFTRRGIAVTATDPDAEMLAELRRQVPAAHARQAALEDLAPTGSYDLVFAAASLHWTEPTRRWSRIASLLGPGGVFAAFGGPRNLADAELEQAVCAARMPFLVDDDVSSPDGTPDDVSMQWPGTELIASEWFTDVRQVRLERRLALSADDYVGHLATVSAYLMLTGADRERVLGRIRAVLPDQVDVVADLTLHLARPAGGSPAQVP